MICQIKNKHGKPTKATATHSGVNRKITSECGEMVTTVTKALFEDKIRRHGSKAIFFADWKKA